jgi:hypothetical protein
MSSPAALEMYCFREALSSLGPLCLTEAGAAHPPNQSELVASLTF